MPSLFGDEVVSSVVIIGGGGDNLIRVCKFSDGSLVAAGVGSTSADDGGSTNWQVVAPARSRMIGTRFNNSPAGQMPMADRPLAAALLRAIFERRPDILLIVASQLATTDTLPDNSGCAVGLAPSACVKFEHACGLKKTARRCLRIQAHAGGYLFIHIQTRSDPSYITCLEYGQATDRTRLPYEYAYRSGFAAGRGRRAAMP